MIQAIPPALERLIKNLMRFPGVGEKSATRMALQILRWPPAVARELGASILELHEKIGICSRCFTFSQEDPCQICTAQGRNQEVICVVEEPGDVVAIEKTGSFSGIYHVLQGVLAPREGIGPDELRIRELIKRTEKEPVKEIIIATSSTVAGEATASYLTDMLKNHDVKVTRIACGIPMGTDLKYADQMTLKKALEFRTSI